MTDFAATAAEGERTFSVLALGSVLDVIVLEVVLVMTLMSVTYGGRAP